MKIDIFPIGLYGENSYILHDHGHVLFIDPGRNAKFLMSNVNESEVVDGIVLTHGHEDHVGAVDDLYDHYHCPVYLHPGDFGMVEVKSRLGAYETIVYAPLTPLTEGKMQIGSFSLNIIHTPGHTEGCVLIQYRNVLFTGDTLFAGDIGRTDLPTSSDEEMYASLQKIRGLSNDLKIYPGHGPSSTILHEKMINPYLVERK